jgi:predicted chitinase
LTSNEGQSVAFRTVYGNTISENGWPIVDEGSCSWITVPGTDPAVSLEIQQGQPLLILRAWAADINAFVQTLRDADSACWTEGNSVATSNHLGGTAEDLDWDDHPMGNADAGWNAYQIATIRDMLAFYEGTVFWGNDWDSPKDSMHFQMGYNTYGNPATADFINRKIRADGFSLYRREALAPAPTPTPAPAPTTTSAEILAAAIGSTVDFATSILPSVQQGLAGSQCTNVNRVAMWLAMEGEESAGFTATVEIGNIDGTTYQGRTWEQITGLANYAAFSQWAYQQSYVSSPTYFVDNPASLGDARWESLGAVWYWTVARPQINSLCDNRDIVGVTEAINGGTNGLAARQARYSRALAQGDALLALTTTPTTGDEDEMAGWNEDLVSRAMVLLENQTGVVRTSRSPFRHVGEGPVNTCGGFAWTADGTVHAGFVAQFAVEYGDPVSIALLFEVAQNTDPARSQDAALAVRVLDKVGKEDLDNASTQISAWLAAEAAHRAA